MLSTKGVRLIRLQARPPSDRRCPPGPSTGGFTSARSFEGRHRGFTLIELLVVLAFVGITMLIGIPAFQNMIVRNRTEGYARDASMLIQRTRLEAIRANRPGAVYLDTSDNALVGFVDADADGAYGPKAGQAYRTTDFELGRLLPPSGVSFEAPAPGGSGKASVDGLSQIGHEDGSTYKAVIFQRDGSVQADGAFRIADRRDNRLELRIAPAATGRVELRMYMPDSQHATDTGDPWVPGGDPDDPNYEPWEWK